MLWKYLLAPVSSLNVICYVNTYSNLHCLVVCHVLSMIVAVLHLPDPSQT